MSGRNKLNYMCERCVRQLNRCKITYMRIGGYGNAITIMKQKEKEEEDKTHKQMMKAVVRQYIKRPPK